jgi:hypothetical protein
LAYPRANPGQRDSLHLTTGVTTTNRIRHPVLWDGSRFLTSTEPVVIASHAASRRTAPSDVVENALPPDPGDPERTGRPTPAPAATPPGSLPTGRPDGSPGRPHHKRD